MQSSGEFTLFEACSALFLQLLDGRVGEDTESLGVGSNLRAAHCQEVLKKTAREEKHGLTSWLSGFVSAFL